VNLALSDNVDVEMGVNFPNAAMPISFFSSRVSTPAVSRWLRKRQVNGGEV
jgi:hypothetical protein